MDPLTMIVTAVVVGATAALKSVAEQAVKDTFTGLKRILIERYSHKPDVTQAVAGVEAKPESQGRQVTLKEELAAVGADKDKEVLQAAQELLKQADPEGARAGRYTVIGDGNVIGNHNRVNVIKQQAGDNSTQIGQARDVNVEKKP